MILAVNLLLWVLVAMLGAMAARRGGGLLPYGVREGLYEFLRLSPRIMIGVIGSGFIAAVLPRDIIGAWLGPHSGFAGLVIAALGGALTPGGAVVGFAIGSAALKSGAGAPQVIAYSTAWALQSRFHQERLSGASTYIICY